MDRASELAEHRKWPLIERLRSLMGSADPAHYKLYEADAADAINRILALEAELREVRAAIVASATDTLWMDTTCPETIVDRIDAALAN